MNFKTNPLLSIFTLFFSSLLSAQSLDDGIKLFEDKKFSQAKPIIEKAYKANPKDPKASFYMGRIYLMKDFQDVDKAEELIEYSVQKEPKNAKYHFILGTVYGQKAGSGVFAGMKYASKVKEEFEKSVSLDPNFIDGRIGLARFHTRAPSVMGGDIKIAKEQASAIEKIDPIKSYQVWADIFKTENNDSKYEEYTQKAIDADPKNTNAINLFGYYFIEKKKYDKAISLFLKYAEIAPNDPNAFDSLGDGYKAKGQTDDALKSYLKAVSVDPKFVASVMNAAKIYNSKGQKKEAISVLKNYISIAKNDDEKEKAEDLLDDID